jgi:hypothetical protein
MPQAAYEWPNQKLFRAAGAKGSLIKEKNFMCLKQQQQQQQHHNHHHQQQPQPQPQPQQQHK